MTITPFQMYWILMLDNFRGAAGILMVVNILLVISLIAILTPFWISNSFGFIMEEENKSKQENQYKNLKKNIKKYIITTLSIVILSTGVLTFVPSTKQMACIVVVPMLANSTVVQKDIPELYDLAKNYMKNKLIESNKKGE